MLPASSGPDDRVLTAARAARTLAGLHAHRPPRIPRRCLPYTPPAVGVPRRKPPGVATSVHRAGPRFELDARHHPGWLPALTLRQRRTSRLFAVARAAVPSPSCGWGRTGAWTAPRCCRLPRRCGNPPGGGCAFASAPAPAGAARRHAAAVAHRGRISAHQSDCTQVFLSKSSPQFWQCRRTNPAYTDSLPNFP
jgi:hypothetical protein